MAISNLSESYFIEATADTSGAYKTVVRFGRNTDIDTGTPEDIWNGGGTYGGFTSTSAKTVDVNSDDDQDKSGGTGALTVQLTGLDGSYNEQTETVTFDASGDATSVNSYIRLDYVAVASAGSLGYNNGTNSWGCCSIC